MQHDVQNLDGQHWNKERGAKCSSVTNLQFANIEVEPFLPQSVSTILQLVVAFFFSVLGEAKALSIIRESRSWKNNAFFQKVGIKIIVFHKKTGDLTWRLYSSITEKTRKH